MRTFRVIASAPASAIFRQGDPLQVNAKIDGVPIRYELQTRYTDSYSTPAPGNMLLIAEGEVADLKSAAAIFVNAGRDIAAVVALSSNAAISPLEPEVVFEASHGQTRHEFFQRYFPDESPALTSRFIDVSATAEMITSISENAEKNRLKRAISQYFEALQYWRHGYELLALSHLFMGVEAIKTACWRHKALTEEKTKEELAAEWGYKKSGRFSLAESLDAASREYLVFQGDAETRKLAKDTSDSFEHGSDDAGKLYAPARQCLVATARYLREAIINVLDISSESKKSLLGEKYRQPRGPLGSDIYLFGDLMGEADNLAPAGSDFPYCDWKTAIKDITFDQEKDRYVYHPNVEFTARIGEGIKLKNLRFEIWDKSAFLPKDLPSSEDEEENI